MRLATAQAIVGAGRESGRGVDLYADCPAPIAPGSGAGVVYQHEDDLLIAVAIAVASLVDRSSATTTDGADEFIFALRGLRSADFVDEFGLRLRICY